MEFQLKSLDEIAAVAQQFVAALGQQKLVAFYGEMGAGKTTFIKALCEELGVTDVVNSPTFSIVNDYATKDDSHVYHFDFYRLKTPQEALDFGVEEYFDSDCYCLMEWPEQIGSLLPDDCAVVTISVATDGTRTIKLDL